MIKSLIYSLACSLSLGSLCAAETTAKKLPDKPKAAGSKTSVANIPDCDNVPYSSFEQYFVRNDCPWDEIHQEDVFLDQDKFNKYFGYAHIKPNLPKVDADTFKQHFIAAMARKSDRVWHYKVHKVSYKNNKLTIQYSATRDNKAAGSAIFMCPLILALPRQYGKAEVKFVSIDSPQQPPQPARP